MAIIFAGCTLLATLGCSRSQDQFRVESSELDKRLDQEGLVLVKFGAPWCGPCRQLDGELEELEPFAKGKAEIVTINVDDEPGLARRYKISSIPRLMLFQDGKKVHDSVGFVKADEMIDWIKKATPTQSNVTTNPYVE
jgi:thioredoxin 1